MKWYVHFSTEYQDYQGRDRYFRQFKSDCGRETTRDALGWGEQVTCPKCKPRAWAYLDAAFERERCKAEAEAAALVASAGPGWSPRVKASYPALNHSASAVRPGVARAYRAYSSPPMHVHLDADLAFGSGATIHAAMRDAVRGAYREMRRAEVTIQRYHKCIQDLELADMLRGALRKSRWARNGPWFNLAVGEPSYATAVLHPRDGGFEWSVYVDLHVPREAGAGHAASLRAAKQAVRRALLRWIASIPQREA